MAEVRTRAGRSITQFKCTAEDILNQSHGLYGPSGTGKTVISNYLLDTIGDEVATIWILSPTEPQNESYKGRVPPQAIRVNITNQSAEEFLTSCWDRQELASSIYKQTQNFEILNGLFNKINPSSKYKEQIAKINEFKARIDKYFRDIAPQRLQFASKQFLESERKRTMDSIERQYQKIFKAAIRPHRETLLNRRDLSNEEKLCLQYLEFNPRTVIVLDDCMASLKKLQKSEILAKITTRGRHVNITSILVLHAVTDLVPGARNNLFKSYFTDATTARNYFDNSLSGFNKPTVREAHEMIDVIYNHPQLTFARLVYIRGAPDPYNWLTAVKNPPRPLGSSYFWKYCNKIGTSGNVIDKDNPFYSCFVTSQ